jgi:inner membrane protein YidH
MTTRPDAAPRITDHLANERTFLAWIRTSLAIIGLGFVMAKFSVWLRQFFAADRPNVPVPRPGLSLPAGLVLMAFGALVAVLALVRYRAVERGIARGEFRSAHGLTALVSIAVAVVAVALIVYLATSSPIR